MWKYVTRRIRDTFERSANHFDKCSYAVVNPSNNISEDKNKSPCCWFVSKKCSNSFKSGNDTNSNRWNFDELNRTWIGAITWSSALVFSWYTSQLLHLKFKKQCSDDNKLHCIPRRGIFNLTPLLKTIPKQNLRPLDIKSQLDAGFIHSPVISLISNEKNEGASSSGISSGVSGSDSASGSSSANGNSDSSDSDLGEVLNSIENRLGLAAIENGQPEDGLNLLRSAAHRYHAPALYNLALCYEMGLGVAVDEKKAMEYYRSAAALQHPGALYNLGIYYGQGRGGLNRDNVTAIRLLKLAAIQGQEDAITALKTLKEDTASNLTPKDDINFWENNQSHFTKHSNLVPIPTSLYV